MSSSSAAIAGLERALRRTRPAGHDPLAAARPEHGRRRPSASSDRGQVRRRDRRGRREPPTVPRLRTWTSPIVVRARPRGPVEWSPARRRSRRRSSARRSRARRRAASRMPLSSARPPMSMSCSGWASRSFISGSRLWPPAMTLAPSRGERASASSTLAARRYSNARRDHAWPPFARLDRAPHLLRGVRHVEVADAERAERVDDGVGDRGGATRCSRPRRRP